jgi:hypothetical protein
MSTRRRIKLLTFASTGFYRQQDILNRSAPAGGVTDCIAWTQEQLFATEFYRRHRAILDASRGSGYWLWKPYLIRRELEGLGHGDFLVYYDVGRPVLPHTITRCLLPLLNWCERSNGGILPGVYVPEHGPNTRWIKRECFVAMGCDDARFRQHPQIQGTYSVWQKSADAESFVDEWLQWCARPEVLTDAVVHPELPNFPDFVDHRHDQAVSTLLAIKRGIRAYGDPNTTLPGSKDINNLVDRIEGNEGTIVLRNLTRTTGRRVRSGWLTCRQTLTRLVGG